MDYTPISTRRVLLAFAFTAFTAFVPAFFVLLQSGHVGPLSLFVDTHGSYRGILLGAGSAILTVAMICGLMLAVVVGRRVVRRPSRA